MRFRIIGLAILASMVVMAGCDKPKPRRPRPKPKPPVEPTPDSGITAAQTGAIAFACVDTSKHEEWEVVIDTCPSCGLKNYFFQDPGGKGFFCYRCKNRVPDDKFVCDRCGQPPTTKIKLKRR
jgi:hypothetical protein